MSCRTMAATGYFFLLVFSCIVNANDTIARVAAGGVVFIKSDSIHMAQEVLEISPTKIRVHYVYKNHKNIDLNETVGFPMPPYGWAPGVNAMDENIRSLKSFKLMVNDEDKIATIHKVALHNGLDITERLRTAGLSDLQIFETFGDCRIDEETDIVCGLSEKQRNILQQLGAWGDGMPLWQVSETAIWEQAFPAGANLDVVHEYVPFVGQSYTVPYQRKFGFVGKAVSLTATEACIDEGSQRAVDQRVKELVQHGANDVYVTLREVEYILGTGRNWKGPIGQFTLKIKKESPDQIISLCFPGKPKWVDSVTAEFKKYDYVPQDKLVVYFYTIATTVK